MKALKDVVLKVLGTPLLALIWLYRRVFSRLLGPSCRYQPTCSVYAAEAVKIHGPFKGF
ncbi:MAG: membrane protein insertion efficiency factor YidD, partial [Bacteroidetes bacterium]|nr:membrane protein insertion efficiency factor YidD [Bacteroidota bacterium]